jgi:DNA repair protein RecO (recombination protein O)
LQLSPDKLYRTEGIVMRRRDQGEADRVLKLCTPLGKIEVIAKGTRKLRSRKAGHVELFSRSWFVISRVANSWDIVSQAEMVEPHKLLRNDLLRGTYARYAVELLDRFIVDGQGDRDLFDLLDRTLARLCEDSDLDLIARYYEQRLLWLAGFRPEVFHCVGEHVGHMSLRPKEPAEEERSYGFDPEQGGALCPNCLVRYKEREEVIELSPDGLWLLQECQRRPYVRLKNQKIAPALHGEVELVMQRYITYHLERDVKSRTFLNQLKREGVGNP